MAINFTLTRSERELQLQSRRFAAGVLSGAEAAEFLPTPEERFLATRPVYVATGFLGRAGQEFAPPH
jgi:nitroalkane oxidase